MALALVLAMGASGCVTGSQKALAVAAGEEKGLAVVAADVRVAGKSPSACGVPKIWIQRFVDGRLEGQMSVAIGSANQIFGGKTTLYPATLEPGTYGIVRVEVQCGNVNNIINARSKGFFFHEYQQTMATFDVSAGEIVNLGTLNIGYGVTGRPGAANSHVGPLEDDVWKAFIENKPELAAKMKFRPMELRSAEAPRSPTARF